MNIELNNVSKSFDGKHVFERLDAVIHENCCTVITGRSGAGKTTLLRMISGLEKQDSGMITGNDARFSFVFQEDRLCDMLSVLANLHLVCSDDEMIQSVLEALGIADVKHTKVGKLSGGQKRRTAIARALIAKYDVLCMDEPMTGLDKDTKQRVLAYIKAQIKGKTAIIATHDDAVISLSDYIIEL